MGDITVRVLAVLGLALLGGCATDSKLREAELGRLASMLPGRYDNAVTASRGAGAAAAPELALQLDVVRIQAPFLGENVFYAQESVHDDPRRILSQRLLALAVEDGRVVQRTLGLADPARWRDGHRNPELFKALMYVDVARGAAGCAIEWSAAATGFDGRVLPEGGCDRSAVARLDATELVVGGLQLRRR